MRLLLAVVATLAACSDKQDEPRQAPPPAAGALVRGDAGVTSAVVDVDVGGRQLDEYVGGAPPEQPVRRPVRQGRPIDITLRSTPPGAQVAVDGAVIGNTPAYWSGMADGREHEFVFTMRRHAIARYRFVPVSSGVIHGRLDPIREDTDAGVPAPPPEVVPPRAPPAPSENPPFAPPAISNDVSAPIPGPVGPTPSADSGEPPVGPMP
ncbi:MAG TPA: PEGA domain-containing protein [Kofleriaceae bacterium]|nr:PEGA domain-containing protein [Kofleriaceae bacterium]